MKTSNKKPVVSFEYEKTTATVYKVKLHNFCGWGNATIRDFPNGGSIDIQSDYGNYSFTWGSTGTKTLKEFLVGISMGYAMGKFCGLSTYETDIEATVTAMKDQVLGQRRDGCLSKESARLSWDDIVGNMENAEENEESILSALYVDGQYIDHICHHDVMDVPVLNRVRPQIQMFWDRVWVCFVEIWQQEIKEETE